MADPTSSEHRLVLLGLSESGEYPLFSQTGAEKLTETSSDPLPQDLADVMSEANIPPLINHSILLDYDYWTAGELDIEPLLLLTFPDHKVYRRANHSSCSS